MNQLPFQGKIFNDSMRSQRQLKLPFFDNDHRQSDLGEMITDQQYRRFMKFLETGDTLATAAAKAGMDQKTASKWRQSGQLPSEAKEPRSYRTRPDAFAEVWSEVEQLLERDAAIEAKTIFDHLCRRYQGKFQEGQLREFGKL